MSADDELETYLHQRIPLSRAMGIRVHEATPARVELRAPLAPNVNHSGTAFGGSVSSLAILSAWALLELRVRRAGLDAVLVIQRSEVQFDQPVRGDFAAICEPGEEGEWEPFRAVLERRGRARLTLRSRVLQGPEQVASFEGDFVALGRSEE